MDDLLEYTRRAYEEQFKGIRKLKCVTLAEDQVCICIHSMAMNCLLYIANSCYWLEGDIKYSVQWDKEYHTYFLKCFCNEQILVPIFQKDCGKAEVCYLEKELCKNKDLPFHYVEVRPDRQWNQAKEECLRIKYEKISDGWNSLLFYCKIVEGFRNCSNREYAERLLRSALFLFPFKTWDILEKSISELETSEENEIFIKYHIALLDAFLRMSVGRETTRTQLINSVGEFLQIPVWSIWEECEAGFISQEFETFLRMKLNECYAMSKRFTSLLNKIEKMAKNAVVKNKYKESISQCKAIVNGLKR